MRHVSNQVKNFRSYPRELACDYRADVPPTARCTRYFAFIIQRELAVADRRLKSQRCNNILKLIAPDRTSNCNPVFFQTSSSGCRLRAKGAERISERKDAVAHSPTGTRGRTKRKGPSSGAGSAMPDVSCSYVPRALLPRPFRPRTAQLTRTPDRAILCRRTERHAQFRYGARTAARS